MGHTHEQLVRFYRWAFSECDRADKAYGLEAESILMEVVRKTNKAVNHTTHEERNKAISEALETA